MPRGRIRESLVERRFPSRFNVCGWQRVHPPTRSKLVWKPALRPSAKDLRMRPSTWTYLDTTTRAGGYARRNAGFIRQPRCGSPGCRINPEFRPECVPLLGPLYGSRCSATATRFPAPPLEERVRERRPLRSTFHRDGLVEDPDGREFWTGIAKASEGLLSPALSSRGGEGEAPAHQAGGYAKRNARFIRQPQCGSPACRMNPAFRWSSQGARRANVAAGEFCLRGTMTSAIGSIVSKPVVCDN